MAGTDALSEGDPIWTDEASRGWNAEIFKQFDLDGEQLVASRLTTYSDNWKAQAEIWLRLMRRAREAADRAYRDEQLSLQRRTATASENQARVNVSIAWATWVTAAGAAVAAVAGWIALHQ